MTEQENRPQTIIINTEKPQSNGIGTAGFVLALVGVFLSWVPVLGWIIWLLGLILSFVGVFRQPRGLSIAGLIISLIGIVFLIAFAAIIASALAFM